MEATLPKGPCPDRSKKINIHRKNFGYVSSCFVKKNNDIAIAQRERNDEKSNLKDIYEDKVDVQSTSTECMKKCKWCDRIIYTLPYHEFWCDVTCCGLSNALKRHRNTRSIEKRFRVFFFYTFEHSE